MKARSHVILAGFLAASLLAVYAFASSTSPDSPAPKDPQPSALQEPAASPSIVSQPMPNGPSNLLDPRPNASISSGETSTNSADKDRFGIAKLYPTTTGGKEWAASWDNGHSRLLQNEIDPDDSWFDTSHGEGAYAIDGQGTMVASGDYVRMYVHDPMNNREWSENLEITLYVARLSETRVVDYGGLQVFARTNHGTVGNEDRNFCDDRGYGALALLDGTWTFEKETAHHQDNGYADLEGVQPWKSLPKDTPVGIKYVLRNMDSDSKVKLELYRDLAGGINGGKWEKLYEFIDDGTNFGTENDACEDKVDPALQLVHSYIDYSSETGKPMLSVYARHEFGTMEYSAFTIREIDPLV